MSMEINSTNSGVTSQIMDLKTSTPGVTRKEKIKTGFKNTNDYSKYLQEKYSYMNTGKTSIQLQERFTLMENFWIGKIYQK